MKIFAHRGAQREAKENTLEAFAKALEIGVDGIELDCLVTKDNIPVVNHDDDLSLKLGREGFICEKKFDEIRDLKIPTLREALLLMANSKTPVIFDIKSQKRFSKSAIGLIAKTAQEILAPEQILLTSFSWYHLWFLKRKFGHLPKAFIFRSKVFMKIPPWILKKIFGITAIHPLLTKIDKEMVEKWHQNGLKVHAWVANLESEMRYCEEMGVDGIFTDDPRSAKTILGK